MFPLASLLVHMGLVKRTVLTSDQSETPNHYYCHLASHSAFISACIVPLPVFLFSLLTNHVSLAHAKRSCTHTHTLTCRGMTRCTFHNASVSVYILHCFYSCIYWLTALDSFLLLYLFVSIHGGEIGGVVGPHRWMEE